MRAALALLVLGAALAFGAGPYDGWPITPEESARIDAEHERINGRIASTLDAIAAQRKVYQTARDKDAAIQTWGDLFGPLKALQEAQSDVWENHRTRHNKLEIYKVTGALRKVAANSRADFALSPELQAIQATNVAMRNRQNRLFARLENETGAFSEAASARAAVQQSEGQARLLRRTGAAAGLLLLAVYWGVRRQSRAEQTPLVLPGLATQAPPPSQSVPALIGGNIDVIAPIGRGGMGEVYEGLDRTLRRKVAVKRLRPELTGSPSDLSRLLNEARLVAALKHPNIVAIHSVEKEAGQVFLVFEHVDGPTLAAVLSQKRRLPFPEALRIFQGAAAALQAAHARDIVHRDLKPGNIMLDSKGVVKVMDFGLAHEAALVVSRLTNSGAWGTPPYMPAEQELGEVNTGVDLFALSVCLYEMLTGEIPFTGPNFLAQKREKVYVPATTAVPSLPKALDAFFAKAFDPDPTKRFQDAATLSAAAASIA